MTRRCMQMHVTTVRCANWRRSGWLPTISADPHRCADPQHVQTRCAGALNQCAAACEGILHTHTAQHVSTKAANTHTLSRTRHPSPAFHLARREHARALWTHTMLQADAPGHCDAHDTSHDVCFVFCGTTRTRGPGAFRMQPHRSCMLSQLGNRDITLTLAAFPRVTASAIPYTASYAPHIMVCIECVE